MIYTFELIFLWGGVTGVDETGANHSQVLSFSKILGVWPPAFYGNYPPFPCCQPPGGSHREPPSATLRLLEPCPRQSPSLEVGMSLGGGSLSWPCPLDSRRLERSQQVTQVSCWFQFNPVLLVWRLHARSHGWYMPLVYPLQLLQSPDTQRAGGCSELWICNYAQCQIINFRQIRGCTYLRCTLWARGRVT